MTRRIAAGVAACLLVAGCAIPSVAPPRPPDARPQAGVVRDIRPVPGDSTLAAAVAAMLGDPVSSQAPPSQPGRLPRVELVVALDSGGVVSVVGTGADGLARGMRVRVLGAPDPRVVAAP